MLNILYLIAALRNIPPKKGLLYQMIYFRDEDKAWAQVCLLKRLRSAKTAELLSEWRLNTLFSMGYPAIESAKAEFRSPGQTSTIRGYSGDSQQTCICGLFDTKLEIYNISTSDC